MTSTTAAAAALVLVVIAAALMVSAAAERDPVSEMVRDVMSDPLHERISRSLGNQGQQEEEAQQQLSDTEQNELDEMLASHTRSIPLEPPNVVAAAAAAAAGAAENANNVPPLPELSSPPPPPTRAQVIRPIIHHPYRKPPQQKQQDCIACRYIWKSVEMDCANAKYEKDVLASFKHNCQLAQKTSIFKAACIEMGAKLFNMAKDYMSQDYTVDQMCSRQQLC